MGYPRETLGYYFYNREEGKMFVARHGVFLEKEFLNRKASGRSVRLEEIREPHGDVPTGDSITTELVREPVVESVPVPRRSERLRNMQVCSVLFLETNEPTTDAGAIVSDNPQV